jgi:hypothetical protein
MNSLHALAEALLERETLVEKEIDAIIAGHVAKSPETKEKGAGSDKHTEDETKAPGELKPLLS